MNDDNSKSVFIPLIHVCEPLNLITQLYNRGLSSDREEKLTLGVESKSWECNEFTSWKARELLVVKANPTLGKGLCVAQDLFKDKTSLQMHRSSKISLAKCKKRAQLERVSTLPAETMPSFLQLVTNHTHSTLHSIKQSPAHLPELLCLLGSAERKPPCFHLVLFYGKQKNMSLILCVL